MTASRAAALPVRLRRSRAASLLVGVLAGAVGIGALAAHQPLLTFAAVTLACLGLALLARPDVATLVVIFVVYVNVPAVAVNFYGAPLVIGLVIPLLLAVPLAQYLLRGEKLVLGQGLMLMTLFLIVQVLATLMALDIDVAWEKVKTFVFEGLLIYFLITNVVRTTEMLRRVVWTLLAAGACLGALALFQDVTGTYSKSYGGFSLVARDYFFGAATTPRLAGPIGDPNYFAQILLVLVPLGMFTIMGERSWPLRLLAAGATGLVVAGVTLTSSRGAGVALLLVLAIMTFFRYVRPRQMAVIVVGLILLVFASPEYRDRVATLTSVTGAATEASRDETGADTSLRSRLTEMLAAAYVFTDHPAFGVGPDHFPFYYQEYASRVGFEIRDEVKFGPRRGESPERESHNMLLSIAADLGLVGLLVFLALVYVALRQLNRARRRWLGVRDDLANWATAFMLALIAYLVTGVFLTLAFERYFWLLVALAGAAGSLATEHSEPEAATRTVRAPKPRSSSS